MLKQKISLLVLPLLATLSLQANDPINNDPFFQDPFGDNIFKEMMQMQQNMDKMFDKMHNRMQQRSSNLVSPLGTYKIAGQEQFVDKTDHYEYLTNIPENKENQIDINIKDNVMLITAKIIEKHENKTANGYSSSSSMRMYQQSLPVPPDADQGSMKAEYKGGKLLINFQKMTQSASSNTSTQVTDKKQETQKNEIPKEEDNRTRETNTTKDKNTSIKKMTIQSDIPSMS